MSRVRSLSTEPCPSRMPQCPWSVYSSTHRSAISTTRSPTSSARSARASWTIPFGSKAWLPTASLVAGTPNSMIAPTPRSASSWTSLRRLSRVCWTTPGSEWIGCGCSMPSRTNSGATSWATSRRVSATSSRIAADRRKRRGRDTGNGTTTSYEGTPTAAPTTPGGPSRRALGAPDRARVGRVACRAVTSQAMFLNTDVAVSLGTTTTERLVVINDGDDEETYRLTPAGLAAGWATLRPTAVTVPAHAQQDVDVEIHPPRLPTTAAGPTGLVVRVSAQRPDADVIEAGITLDVLPVRERRVALLQPAQRGRFGATYELTVDNRGNTQASCRLRLL